MKSRAGQALARRVVDFFQLHGRARSATVRHFMAEGEAKSTLYGILRRFERGAAIEYANGNGPKPTKCTLANVQKLKNFFVDNPRATNRQAASKLKMSETSVRKLCKMGAIETRKRTKAPAYVKNQVDRCKAAAAIILNRTAPRNGNKIIVMDDEMYCYIEPDENASATYFKEVPGHDVPDSARFKRTSKFGGKYLIWQAIGSDGKASRPYISTGTMNGQIYYKKCLKAILLPWLKANYDLGNVLFWPDLATCHYTAQSKQFFEENEIDFVRKIENAPNLPQARPIERFWALCKREYSKLTDKPKSLAEFRKVYRKIYKRIITNSGNALFDNLRQKLALVRKDGPYGPLKVLNQ